MVHLRRSSTRLSDIEDNTPSNAPVQASYVLLAEFNIDLGLILAHQYPAPTGIKESTLAELMIPDGAHGRERDWTMFLLNQHPSNTVEWALESDDENGQRAEKKLLYVLSCAKTRKDESKRGATVKAMAVCSPYPYIQIFKGPLLFALDEYFETESPLVLGNLYECLNSIDTSSMPHLSREEKIICSSSSNMDLFQDKFDAVNSGTMGEESGSMSASTSGGDMAGQGEEVLRDREGEKEEAETADGEKRREGDTGGGKAGLGINAATGEVEGGSAGTSQSSSKRASVVSLGPEIEAGMARINLDGSTVLEEEEEAHLAEPPLSPASLAPSSTHLPSSSDSLSSSSKTFSSSSSSTPTPSSTASSSSNPSTSSATFASTTAAPRTRQTSANSQLSSSTGFASSLRSANGGGRRFSLAPSPDPSRMGGIKSTRDTHFFTAYAAFRKVRSHRGKAGEEEGKPPETIQFPFQIPMDYFDEQVGHCNISELVKKFINPSHSFPGPYIPSLHTSLGQTNPIILLINALLTQRRIIFLGHKQAAEVVARYVLTACALVSGGGSLLRGFTRRAFPYTNLTQLDILDEIPGFIAGVTNPRFEDLTSRWDVCCNIVTGRITVSKDIKPDSWSSSSPPSFYSRRSSSLPAPADNPISFNSNPSSLLRSSTSSNAPGVAGLPPNPPTTNVNIAPLPATPSMIPPPGLTTITSSSASMDRAGGSGGGGGGGEETSGSNAVKPRSVRSDSNGNGVGAASSTGLERERIEGCGNSGDLIDASFIEKLSELVHGHPSRHLVQAYCTDYIRCFIKLASRHAEETTGRVLPPRRDHIWYPCMRQVSSETSGGSEARLGSGALLLDGRSTSVREYVGANGVKRIEGWRASRSCELWIEDFTGCNRPKLPLDFSHQLTRARRTQNNPTEFCELFYKTLANNITTYEQTIHILSHLPLAWHQGEEGLKPLAIGLYHSNPHVRGYTMDFFDNLQRYPIGIMYLKSLSFIDRHQYHKMAAERALTLDLRRQQLWAELESAEDDDSAILYNVEGGETSSLAAGSPRSKQFVL